MFKIYDYNGRVYDIVTNEFDAEEIAAKIGGWYVII